MVLLEISRAGRKHVFIQHWGWGLQPVSWASSPFRVYQIKLGYFFLICICAQHFFSGGEYHGSIVFSLEHSEHKKSGIMSALSCLFAVFGLVAANGLATLTLMKGSELWMRICFLIGALEGCSVICSKHTVEKRRHLLLFQTNYCKKFGFVC